MCASPRRKHVNMSVDVKERIPFFFKGEMKQTGNIRSEKSGDNNN